jgi:hypothetical protein
VKSWSSSWGLVKRRVLDLVRVGASAFLYEG